MRASGTPDSRNVDNHVSPALRGERVVTTSAERYVMSAGHVSRLAIKEGDLYLCTNDVGQVPGGENSELGLYYRDTRYLSRFELVVAGRQPVLLGSSAESGHGAAIELTNLESRTTDGRLLPQACVHVRRTRFLADRLRERIDVRNHHHAGVEIFLDLHMAADFADVFEVRGLRRGKRGTPMPPRETADSLVLAYVGLDDVDRQTVIRFVDQPESIKHGRARYRVRLRPGERVRLHFEVEMVGPGVPVPAAVDFTVQRAALRNERESWHAEATEIVTDNEIVNAVLRRGRDDLRMLSATVEGQRIVLSGVPWFVAPFGREMLFASLETPLLDLRWAAAAVEFLGSRQGKAEHAFREEQPGKIMHELRRGELAALGAIPHTPYYGAVDTTPLWLLALTELTMWSGDLDRFESWQGGVDAALGWLASADVDGDGFVEYARRSRTGLTHQGWRDADDALVHADGTPVKGPIALAETQAYVYYAKRRLAAIYGRLGDVRRAERLTTEAAALKTIFNQRFWMDDERYFALALDGQKRQVEGVCSTIGHALWARIVADEHVPAVVSRLVASDMFTGWGLRTLSEKSYGYNPMSYYNGSVWPFDTALAANGMHKHGYAGEASMLAWGLVEAAAAHETSRLPELFCGFTRQAINKPVSFPMACAPDAGSAGALFLVFQSMLGVHAQAETNTVYVHKPVLPSWLGEVSLRNLRVGHTTLSLRFRRDRTSTRFSVLDKRGSGRVVVVE